jgi:hypothetical protein
MTPINQARRHGGVRSHHSFPLDITTQIILGQTSSEGHTYPITNMEEIFKTATDMASTVPLPTISPTITGSASTPSPHYNSDAM